MVTFLHPSPLIRNHIIEEKSNYIKDTECATWAQYKAPHPAYAVVLVSAADLVIVVCVYVLVLILMMITSVHQ